MYELPRSMSIALRLLFGLLTVISLTAVRAPAEPDWTLKREGEAMWVYTRDRAGSDIKEVRLVMEVDATIAAINDVVDDAKRQTEWVFRCTEARDLGGHIDTGWYYYSRIDMPWPMDDRDLAAKVVGDLESGLYESKSVAAPDRTARVGDCVRITDFDVRTSYRALDEGRRTEMTYDLHSEPGGAIPVWMVNMFVDKGPVATMTQLRDLVEGR